MQQHYDVVILGGGLAGLALSIQLKRSTPDIKIIVLESRKGAASIAAHKVGESTVELATQYLRETLGLKDYLEKHELPKFGLRFFFKSNNKQDITTRVELGPRYWLHTPSHQLDRGTLENHMAEVTQRLGTDFILDARVKDVVFSADGNVVSYIHAGKEETVTGKWVADASGRGSVLKRKLNFSKPLDHPVNAVWWRLKGKIDIERWSDSEEWKAKAEKGLRYLSTVHFMDKGYWVWVIPLGTGNTSIGIVADPRVHPFETFDNYKNALNWLKANEPLCYKMLEPETPNKMDFKILKHFAHHTGRLFDGTDRWGVTGEAGFFLDPFYSPGSDLISLNNTWLSDLILRDLNGEDVQFRAEIYEQTALNLFDSWVPIYQDKYMLMGNTQIMLSKIVWDWAIYWSVPCLLFTNNAFTDLKMIKQLFASPKSPGQKFKTLSERMQQLFLDWLPYENEIFEGRYLDPVDMNFMLKFQHGIVDRHGDKLLEQIAANIIVLEKIAAELYRQISHQVKGTPLDIKVDPYTMVLDPENKLNLPGADESVNIPVDEDIRRDVSQLWYYGKKELV